jgi:hypothetical protein
MAADPTAQVHDRLQRFVGSLIDCLLQLQQPQMKQATAESSTASATATTPNSTGASPEQQQQQQQQAVSWSPGLLVTCIKALSQCIEQRLSTPMRALKSVLRLALLCPGLTALVDITDLPVDGKPFEQVLTTVMLQTWLESDSKQPSGASGTADSVPLVLLIGRALHVVARALLQLHESAEGAAATGRLMPHQQQDERAPQVLVPVLSALLYFYLAALGPLLKQAAEKVAAASSSSSSASTADDGNVVDQDGAAAVQQHISEIKQLQKLQQNLLKTVWQGAVAVIDSCVGGAADSRLTTGAAAMREMIPAAAAQQLLQLATGVCTQLVLVDSVAQCCANPGCTNCSKLSEHELVGGKGTVCSSCRAVRLCSAECNKAYWKAGHKQVCKRLGGGKQQQTGGDGKQARSGSNSSSSSGKRRAEVGGGNRSSSSAGPADSTSNKDSGSSSAAAAAAAAAGFDLLSSAAAAAALSVRQLKALLAGLRVDCAAAVEKSDLVGALVAHLGLA